MASQADAGFNSTLVLLKEVGAEITMTLNEGFNSTLVLLKGHI